MSNPQENTKIEQLTDAIENLAIAIARSLIVEDKITNPHRFETPELLAINRKDARDEMATALRELLKPTLRVVTAAPVDAVSRIEMPKIA